MSTIVTHSPAEIKYSPIQITLIKRYIRKAVKDLFNLHHPVRRERIRNEILRAIKNNDRHDPDVLADFEYKQVMELALLYAEVDFLRVERALTVKVGA